MDPDRRIVAKHFLRFSVVFLLVVFSLAFGPYSAAQATVAPMDDAAAKIADQISHAKLKSVVVFDFSGPDNRLTQLGLDLAASFRTALAKSGPELHVLNTEQVHEFLDAALYAPEFVLYPESLLAAAQEVHAHALVVGQISLEGDKIVVVVSAYRCDDGKGIRAFRVSWPLTEDIRGRLARTVVEESRSGLPSGPPDSTAKHHTPPQCGYCPRADYTEDAMRHQFQGTVELVAIVDRDGTIKEVRVRKPAPYGLTYQAIKAVRQWKLSPPIDPDGKPESVRQIIEVTFQL